MLNFNFIRKKRSKNRSHRLFSALRYILRPLYANHKIRQAFLFHSVPVSAANCPRKGLTFDRSLRQLRTERTLKGRRSSAKQPPVPGPVKTKHISFEKLGDEVANAFQGFMDRKVPITADDQIFFRQLQSLNSEHVFKKELQASREQSQRGARDAPKLEKRRQARAAMAAAQHAEKGERENMSSSPRQPVSSKGPKSRSSGREGRRTTAATARKQRISNPQERVGRGRRKGLADQKEQVEKATPATKRKTARKEKQDVRKEDPAEQVPNEAARNETRQDETECKEQAGEGQNRGQGQTRIGGFAKRPQYYVNLEERERLRRRAIQQQQEILAQEELRRKEEQLRTEEQLRRQEQAWREQQAWEQARRNQAARERAVLEEAHRAAMRRREDNLRRAASGERALPLNILQHQEAAFRHRMEFVRQSLLAGVAECARLGVPFTPPQFGYIDLIALYEVKWDELKNRKAYIRKPLTLMELPWPVFEPVTHPEAITYAGIHAFVFNEGRPGIMNKTKRDRLRPEILKYHPDKFDNNILPLVLPEHVEVVRATADRVVKLLNQLMELSL